MVAKWLPQLVGAVTGRLHPLPEWAHELLRGREFHSSGRSGRSQPARAHSFYSTYQPWLPRANRNYDATRVKLVHLRAVYSPKCREVEFSELHIQDPV
jgi:hypothetical protein